MKKTLIMVAVVTFVTSSAMSAYAYYGHYGRGRGMQSGMYGQQGGMMYGRQGGMSDQRGGRGRSQGRGSGWNANSGTCPCGAYGNQTGRGWKAPVSPQSAPDMIPEEKAKEIAQEYVAKYLTGYTIDKIEKDSWRPLYFVTLKGENVKQLMTVHGFAGQVMHVFPKTAE